MGKPNPNVLDYKMVLNMWASDPYRDIDNMFS